MKKLILTLLFGLLAVPALHAAEASEGEVKVRTAESAASGPKATCMICNNILRNPIKLPCGHKRFDLDCFMHHVDHQIKHRLPVRCFECDTILSNREILLLDQGQFPKKAPKVDFSKNSQCMLCLNDIVNPIHLPCGHNNKFDTACFLRYADAQNGKNLPVQCSVCSRAVTKRELIFLDRPRDNFLFPGRDRGQSENKKYKGNELQKENERLYGILARNDEIIELQQAIIQHEKDRAELLKSEDESAKEVIEKQDEKINNLMNQNRKLRVRLEHEISSSSIGYAIIAAAMGTASALAAIDQPLKSRQQIALAALSMASFGTCGAFIYDTQPNSQPLQNGLRKTKELITRNKLKIVTSCATLMWIGNRLLAQKRQTRQTIADFMKLGLYHEPQVMLRNLLVTVKR